MSKTIKSIWEPVQTLFTAPKRLFRTGTKYGQSNWIADIAIPLVLGAAGPAGPFLSAGYGALRQGAISDWDPLQMAWGGVKGWGAGGLGGTLGATTAPATAAARTAAGATSVLDKIGWGAKQYWGATTAPFTRTPTGKVAWGAGSGAPGAPPAGFTYPTSTMPFGVAATQTAGKGLSLQQLMAGGAAAASLLAKPPEVSFTGAEDRLTQARESIMTKYLGDAAAQLPSAVSENYLDMITKPLGELYPIEQDARWGRMEKLITQSYDDYEASINASFAQAGGTGSSDHREAIRRARADRAEELSQSRRELEQDIFETQVKIKQDALMNAAQQNQFDWALAYQLAALIGQDEELERAIATEDYGTFQRVMGSIMSLGLETPMPDLLGIRRT